MIYALRFVTNHPVYRLHKAAGHFLEHGLAQPVFGADCFEPWFFPIVENSPVLRERFRRVFEETRNKPKSTRDSVLAVWKCHDGVQKLCDDPKSAVAKYRFRNAQLVEGLRDLFRHLYDLTLESAIFEEAVGSTFRDHYDRFRSLEQRVCPFCGLNNYRDRGPDVRSSYDHYLPRTHYPLGSVNFKNLIPMCDECNQAPNKGPRDILFRDGRRRKRWAVYYPYGAASGVRVTAGWVKKPQPGYSPPWR